MLDVFSLIFVADTKIIFRYDFAVPLNVTRFCSTMPLRGDYSCRHVVYVGRLVSAQMKFPLFGIVEMIMGLKFCYCLIYCFLLTSFN